MSALVNEIVLLCLFFALTYLFFFPSLCFQRVLEASIAENKASLKRTHPEVWSDSPNPYDRKRQDNCPVGLKNVGNTCWFSAVIQVSTIFEQLLIVFNMIWVILRGIT